MEHWDMCGVRISLLWVLDGLAYMAYLGFIMTAPGVIDAVKTGTLNGTSLESASYVFEFLFFILLIMAFLTLTLKYSVSRWLNVAVGAIIAVLEFVGMTQFLTDVYWPIMPLWIAKIVIAASIAWLAYRWPRPTTQLVP